MNDLALLENIKKLSPEEKKEIEDHLTQLLTKEKTIEKYPKFGFAKGAFKILPGFDDPLEGMEEYL
jgi:hypothetical protein